MTQRRAGADARATLTALASLAVLAVVAAVAPSAAAAQHRVARTAQLDHDGYLRIWNLAGSVRVTPWDRDSVRVEGTLDDRARAEFYFGAAGSAGKMGVGGSAGEPGRAELHVTVPRGATVWIKTSTAPVEVEGVEGGVDVYSVTGDVRVDGAPRSLVVESMGGRLEVAGRPGIARVKGGSGDLVFTAHAGEAVLSTVRGDIVVRDANVGRATIETVSGAVRFEGEVRGGGSLDIRTHDGAIVLALPSDAPADYWVQAITGEIENRFRSGRDPVSRPLQGREVRFTTGSGQRAAVSVRTFSGSVILASR